MRYYYRLIIFCCGILFITNSCNKDNQEDPGKPMSVFDIVWADFDETYPYFIQKGVNWDSVHMEFSAMITDSTSDEEIFNIIGDMTLLLKDIHVYLKSSYGLIHYSKKQNYPENPPDNAIEYLEDISIDNSKGIFGQVANTNYSYLRIKTFNGDHAEFSDLVSALSTINNKNGLIIDIRSNGGGNELIGRDFAGRFVSDYTPYRNTRYRDGSDWSDFTPWDESFLPSKGYLDYNKPIILLTNRRIYSSAELFVLMMKSYDRLIIVGDTTGAASANPILRYLSNGWQYRLSRWQVASLDYNLIEDNGISPDHYILMTEQSIAEGKDLILEKAIELLDGQ